MHTPETEGRRDGEREREEEWRIDEKKWESRGGRGEEEEETAEEMEEGGAKDRRRVGDDEDFRGGRRVCGVGGGRVEGDRGKRGGCEREMLGRGW